MNNVFLHLHPVRVRQHAVKFAYTFCLGGLSFFLFLVLTVTGVYLMFFYVPSATPGVLGHPRHPVARCPFGLLTRNIHRWAAHLMVFFVFLHMMRVFYHGAYKPPREFNWVVGRRAALPDDHAELHRLPAAVGPDRLLGHHHRHATWPATRRSSTRPSKLLLLGGIEVGQNTLLRFYVLHIMVFPLVAAIFLAVHFWRIRKDGGISGPL